MKELENGRAVSFGAARYGFFLYIMLDFYFLSDPGMSAIISFSEQTSSSRQPFRLTGGRSS